MSGARAWVMALGLAAAAGCHEQPLHGVVIADPYPAPPLELPRASGAPYVLAQDTGRVVLLYFGYTSCPDFCPMMLRDWKRVKADLGPQADRTRFVFVAVDPQRDTPAVADAFARRFDSTFVGLATDSAQLAALTRAWHITVVREPASVPSRPDRYSVAHPAQAFLVNRAGRVQVMYPPETPWQDVAADLRRLP